MTNPSILAHTAQQAQAKSLRRQADAFDPQPDGLADLIAEARNHPAVLNLIGSQRQLDADGCEVGVSRQALDETFDLITRLADRLSLTSDGGGGGDPVAEAAKAYDAWNRSPEGPDLNDCLPDIETLSKVAFHAGYRAALSTPGNGVDAELRAFQAFIEEAGALAKKQLGASKLVGPREYTDKPHLYRAWVRALYHEGKDLREIVRRAKALALNHPANPDVELRALSEAGTQGPWVVEGSIYKHMIAEIRATLPGSERGIAQVWKHAGGFADARLIVAAVNRLREQLREGEGEG